MLSTIRSLFPKNKNQSALTHVWKRMISIESKEYMTEDGKIHVNVFPTAVKTQSDMEQLRSWMHNKSIRFPFFLTAYLHMDIFMNGGNMSLFAQSEMAKYQSKTLMKVPSFKIGENIYKESYHLDQIPLKDAAQVFTLLDQPIDVIPSFVEYHIGSFVIPSGEYDERALLKLLMQDVNTPIYFQNCLLPEFKDTTKYLRFSRSYQKTYAPIVSWLDMNACIKDVYRILYYMTKEYHTNLSMMLPYMSWTLHVPTISDEMKRQLQDQFNIFQSAHPQIASKIQFVF
jgi:hypothetical protein